jgi:predicted metal-dependent HD superfamily phosphohydrolase
MPGDYRHDRLMNLVERWVAAARGAGATAGDDALAAAGEALLARWREPHRHYHTVDHLAAMLSIVDAEGGGDPVRLATWYHDAVYDPRSPGDANERESAALARAELAGLGVPEAVAAEVERLVLLTAGHAVAPGDGDGELLCDADLAVLARPPAEYDAYAAAVRREYAHVPDELFRAGRAAVLRSLLDLPALYRRPALAARWEDAARANLERELHTLS